MKLSLTHIFRPRKRRISRYGRYDNLHVEIIDHKSDGTVLVFGRDGNDRFSAYPDELTPINRPSKPIHGTQQILNNDGSLRTRGNDDSHR